MNYKETLCDAIYSTPGAFKVGYFILTSGKLSPFFINTRNITSYPKNRDIILSALTSKTEELIGERFPDVEWPGHTPAYIVSSESAGIAWGAMVASELMLPSGFVRKEGKFEGSISKDNFAFGVDDLNTTFKTGKLLVETTRAQGATIEDVLFIVDRGENNPGLLNELGIDLHSLVTVKEDLLPYGLKTGRIDAQLYEDIQAYYNDENEFAMRALKAKGNELRVHPRWERLKEFYKDASEIMDLINKFD